MTKAVVRRFADMSLCRIRNVAARLVVIQSTRSDQRSPDEAPDHHRCAAPRVGAAHHAVTPIGMPAGTASRGRGTPISAKLVAN